ncbi:hypothetical protein C0J52_02695 [Blattella germanica]|nr:hypothetical protein C0J52_02695 [Blattella germanica]
MMDTGVKGTTMKERTQSLLDTGLGYDCEFLVGSDDNKVLFKASKAFLIRASPVFERMFIGGLQTSYPVEVPDIEPEVFKVVRIYAHEVLENSNFETINKASLIDILQQDYMNVYSELEVFEAVNRWARAQCKEKGLHINGSNLQMEVKDAVGYIRFLTMSSSEFAEGPGESELLSTEDKLAILKTIVTHGKLPLPSHLCPNLMPRRECVEYV